MPSRRRPVNGARLEVVISRAVAAFGLLFGAQAVPALFAQQPFVEPSWWAGTAISFYGLLLLAVVAAIARVGVRTVNAVLAAVFLLLLVLWVPSIAGPSWGSDDRPWLWFLMTVATAAAAVAFPVWVATAYLALAPALYGVVRASPYGGSAPLGLVGLDVLYAILLGGAVLVIITMLRSAAASVDAAQATALERYGRAVREHATEVERVQVDSIVHDSVLTAFLTAGRADTAEQRELAATLARNAIAHLREAEAAAPDDDATVDIRSVVDRISEARGGMTMPFHLNQRAALTGTLPALAADAVVAATLQAMVNSLQHAGEGSVERWVTAEESDAGGILIEVGDTGVGFDLRGIPAERLGVRVSILERMSGAGGSVEIVSRPGEGTVVRLRWPADVLPTPGGAASVLVGPEGNPS
ncbi:signal transduction histidine kinase [Homoserinimonas aerilata]|uniref:Signal transduction histidine kinase n=2 Tax=Homoserinimonas aerilata TaxID=1162970 RepID=A0A542YKS5_9MICO|nr:signal transduction histidine kinase [Homoserinimonas aerilata]